MAEADTAVDTNFLRDNFCLVFTGVLLTASLTILALIITRADANLSRVPLFLGTPVSVLFSWKMPLPGGSTLFSISASDVPQKLV